MRAFIVNLWLPIILLFVYIPLFGQTIPGIPGLNNHRFINNLIVKDPFTKSAFRTNMGIGNSMRFNLPPIDIGDTTISPTSGNLLYANLNFQLDLRLKEWLSYTLRVGTSARVGAEPLSLFTNGLNAIMGISNSWKIRIYQNEKHFLSTSYSIINYTASVTNISSYIEDIIDGNPNANLSQTINVLQFAASAHYAYAIGSVVGVQAMGKFKYGDLFESGKSGGSFNITGAIDFNLYPKTTIPMGLSLAYGFTTIPDYTATQYNTTSVFNAKLAYTGAETFLISIDGTTFTAPYEIGRTVDQSEAETRAINISLNLIVYFN